MSDQAVLRIQALRHSYEDGAAVLELDQLSLAAGDQLAVLGPSGCGKSTLLHTMAGLLRPSSGNVEICGQALNQLDAGARDRFRGQHIGIIFQRLHLIPALNVIQNLALAQRLARTRIDLAHCRTILAQLGLEAFANASPQVLSQGQAQRVAVARALVHRPALLLADEPTSSLDDDNAARTIGLIQAHARACNAALVVVTHDQRLRGSFPRELHLRPSA